MHRDVHGQPLDIPRIAQPKRLVKAACPFTRPEAIRPAFPDTTFVSRGTCAAAVPNCVHQYAPLVQYGPGRASVDVRVVDTVPLDDASVLVARHEGDAPVQADASRLPLASRRLDAVVKAYDVESIVGADVKTRSRYVLVAPGGKRDVGDSTTTASTVLSRKQQRHAKRRANSSASVASDAPTERDFGEIEFRELLDQPDAIPEEEGEELDLERLRIASEDSEALDAEFFGA